jgi:hypothetical protein
MMTGTSSGNFHWLNFCRIQVAKVLLHLNEIHGDQLALKEKRDAGFPQITKTSRAESQLIV